MAGMKTKSCRGAWGGSRKRQMRMGKKRRRNTTTTRWIRRKRGKRILSSIFGENILSRKF